MKFKNIAQVVFGLVALTSCSSVSNKTNNTVEVGAGNPRPTVVFYKSEDTTLPDYTENYGSEHFDIRGDYLYKGEQLDNQYMDSETIQYRTRVSNDIIILKETDTDYSKYPNSTDDKYEVTISKIKNPKYNGADTSVPKEINQKTIVDKTKKFVYVTLRSTDTGEERTVKINKSIKEIDPVEVVKKYYPDVARYKDLKNGLDNKRISLDVAAPDISRVKLEKNDKSIYKYEDLDDMVGEFEVDVRVRVNGFASERDRFIKKKVVFGDKIEDYNGKYNELLSDLSKQSLRFSRDGSEVLGGFDEYKVSRLLSETQAAKEKDKNDNHLFDESKKNNEGLRFVTRILDESKDTPTVGKHKVVREIIKDGKVIYSKKDEAFVGFNGPTVLVTDNSFFDLSPEIEKRTYRQTPYYTDPKFDYQDMAKNEEEYKKKLSAIERTHGATVIGSMIDELSYSGSYFWRANQIAAIGLEGNKPLSDKNRISDKRLNDLIDTLMTSIVEANPDKVQFQVIQNDINKMRKQYLQPAIEGKYKPIGGTEVTLTDDQKSEYLKKYYDFIREKGMEMRGITEEDKIPYTDINFHVVSIGMKDGRSVNPTKVGNYLPKILDENKNIKLVNMSYGADHNFNEFAALEAMSDDEKQKATNYYNENPLYRFMIQAWLKSEKETLNENISKGQGEYFNALDLYDYFKSKDKINKNDFDKLVKFRKNILEQAISNAKEFSAANHDVLMIRSMGNTYNAARVDLTSFNAKGKKNLFLDPNLKYNNNLGSVPSMINYLGQKEAQAEGKDYKYDYSYRKNLLEVVGVASKLSPYGSSSTDNFLNYGIGSVGVKFIKEKRITTGMYDYYISLVKELNNIRRHPEQYTREYEREIENQIIYVEDYSSKNGHKDTIFSLTRAGESKLWAIAAEGEYVYVTKKDNKGKTIEKPEDGLNVEFGSSFAAPRVTAVGAKVQQLFPWMSAHQIKQTLLTTAKDDFGVLQGENGKRLLQGIYGVDENIGWGLLDKEKAYKGPARFVKALTHEVGEENFIADVKSGVYNFENDIEGSFDILRHMISRNKIGDKDVEEIEKIGKEQGEEAARNKYQDKIVEYLQSLPFEERELFLDAGLVKKGKGTLMLSGNNTYKGDTVVQEGTLIVRGGSQSNHYVEQGAKLKLDINHDYIKDKEKIKDLKSIFGTLVNKGEVYSYSDSDAVSKYVPYRGSKTYVTPESNFSAAALDLTYTDDFNIELIKSRGVSNIVSRFIQRKSKPLFEAKTTREMIEGRVKLGTFPISEKLSLAMEYKDNKLTASLLLGGFSKPAEDKRPGGDKPPFLDELNKKLEELGLAKKAEEGAADGSKPKPGTHSLEKISDALDTILYANVQDAKKINGEALADSLLSAYTVSSLKLDENNKLLNQNLGNKKLTVIANNLNEFNITKDSVGKFDINTRVNGVNVGLGYRNDNTKVFATAEYINGDVSQDDIASTKYNALGANLLGRYSKNNVELDGIISTSVMFKNVVKDFMFETRKEHTQNQFTLSTHLNGGYRFNINDKGSIKPYVGLDLYTFIFGKYNEEKYNEETNKMENESLLGLKYNTQANVKVSARLGLDATYKINDMFDLNFDASYTKWLTDPTLKLKVESAEFEEIKNEVESIKLSDNDFRFGVGLNINPTNNLTLRVNYGNKNLTTQKLTLGLNYQF